MKAVVFQKYGGNEVVEIREMPKPVCGAQDVLIKVHSASINPVDWKVRYGHVRIITGSRFPKILGNECAGEIAEVGSMVKKFKQGDQVIAWPSVKRLGAFAEYASAGQTSAFRKSKSISYEQAACLPIAGLTALQALRDKGQISYGKKVLINGASGGVGHFGIQIAKIFGAEVTGVCSGANFGMVKGLGADKLIDYTKEDFTRGSTFYDIIFDAVAKRSFADCKKVLTPHGVYVSTLPSPGVILNRYITGLFSSKKALTIWVKPNEADLQWMMNQVAAGRIKIVIDRTYPIAEAKEALAYSETGKAKGKIVLKISE